MRRYSNLLPAGNYSLGLVGQESVVRVSKKVLFAVEGDARSQDLHVVDSVTVSDSNHSASAVTQKGPLLRHEAKEAGERQSAAQRPSALYEG
jgi:hypothetical protein